MMKVNSDKSITASLPRVLVVENDEVLRFVYQELLALWGYQPVIASGDGKDLLKNAEDLAWEERCHLAIVDMKLTDDFDDDNDKSGLGLIQKLLPAKTIIVSGVGNVADARKSLEKGAVAFVGKEEGHPAVREKLDSEILKICARRKGLVIEPVEMVQHVGEVLLERVPEQYFDQIEDLFLRLFPTAQTLKLQKLGEGTSKFLITSAPRPNSVVFKVSADGREPLIIKLARVERIQQERENYEKYIEDRLVGQFNSRLLNTEVLWDLGGLKYTFVGTKEQPFTSLFTDESVENIEKSLERLFKQVWSKHYANAVEQRDYPLFEKYSESWGGDKWNKKALNLESKAAGNPLCLATGQTILPANAITWLKTHILEAQEPGLSQVEVTKSAVTHGDLHADNLLIDENGAAWVIDFERSGEGHIFRDFIELESDIIHRLTYSTDNLEDYVKLCLEIARHSALSFNLSANLQFNDEKIEKALHVIAYIRALAQSITKISDARQYLLGLYFDTIFYATIVKKDDARQRRAFMLASILCHRLEHWEEAWPPAEWQVSAAQMPAHN